MKQMRDRSQQATRREAHWQRWFGGLLLLVWLTLGHTPAGGQPQSVSGGELVLRVDDAILIALDESYRIKQLRESMLWAERNLWAAKAGYRTYARSSFYAPAYDEGTRLIEIAEGNPVAKDFGSLQVRGVLDLVQPLPWVPLGGGELTFRSEAFQLNSRTPSTTLADVDLKSNRFYTSLRMILEKPLFTINEVSLGLERAELAYERQSRVFKRSELDLVYRVTNSFYQLYSRSREAELSRESVARQEDIHRTTVAKFKAGLIAEVDAMQAEVELIQSRNELEQAEGSRQEQEAALKRLIGVPLDIGVRLVDDLDLKLVEIDPQQAVELALQNRSELAEKQIDIEERKITIRQVDARVAIKGSLKGYYDFSGYSDPDLEWGTATGDLFSSSWDELRQTPNRGVTIELQVPIWDWGRNDAEVEAAKAQLRQDELTLEDLKGSIETEVRDVVRRTRESWSRVQMLAQSSEVSQRSFDISLQRFANGDITSTELARASDQLIGSKTSHLSAIIEYKLALADLKRKTLHDFEPGRSLVE